MKKIKHVFLSAWEAASPDLDGAEPKGVTPALYSIEVQILRSFVELHGSIDPPDELKSSHFSEGPIIWNKSASKLVFAGWFWSVRDHEFKPVHFYAEPSGTSFADGNAALVLRGASTPQACVQIVQSIPISIEALGRMVFDVERRRQHLIALNVGVAMFHDFNAFEHLFRKAVEGYWGLESEYCVFEEVPQ